MWLKIKAKTGTKVAERIQFIILSLPVHCVPGRQAENRLYG
jgi:hypothetical protein